MAAISKRESKWQARVRTHGYPTVCRTFLTRGDATRWAREIEIQQQRGIYQREGTRPATLDASLDRYRTTVTPTKRSGDKEAYLIGRIRADFGILRTRPLNEVRATDIAALRDRWLRDGYAAASVVRRLGIIGHLFEVARKEWNFVGVENPVRLVRMPRISNARSRCLMDGELDRIIAATESEQLPALAMLLLETAMRRGEALGLTFDRVDWARSVAWLDMTKSGKGREVALSSRAVGLLRGITPARDGRFFTFNPTTASGAWARAVRRSRDLYEDECRRVGRTADPRMLVDLKLHDLRHTRLTQYAIAGWGMGELMAAGGHSTASQLSRYVHVQSAHLVRRIAELDATHANAAQQVTPELIDRASIVRQASPEAVSAQAPPTRTT